MSLIACGPGEQHANVRLLAIYFIILAATLAACVLVFAGTAVTLKLDRRRLAAGTVLALLIFAAICITRPGSWIVSTGAVLVTAIFAGTAIGRSIKSEPSLIAMCVAAAVADVVSVSVGLTHKMFAGYTSGQSQLLVYFCFSVPIGNVIAPLVGLGDLLIMGALFCGLRNLTYAATETFAVPVTGLLAALVIGLAVRHGVPALPFMAGSVAIYILARRKAARFEQS
ncbi:MAG: hypothetical protein ACM3SW_02485 [Actinomycetota bacterium]